MKRYIKALYSFLVIFAGFFVASRAYAMENAMSGIINAAIDPSTIPTTLAPGSISAVLCSIRLLFCGKVEYVVISTAIFLLGIAIINKKIRWPYAILIITCIVILAKPQVVVKMILEDFMGITIAPLGWFADICTCTLVNQIPWF